MSLVNSHGLPRFAASTSSRERRWHIAIRLLVLTLLPFLGGACDDAAEPEVASPMPEAARGPVLPRITWLDQHNATTPGRWLASWDAKADLAEKDQAVVSMRESLSVAAHRFGDPPRMIANRAVQLEGMLASAGISERAPELIVSLSAISAARPREGFGSLCQLLQFAQTRLKPGGGAPAAQIEGLTRRSGKGTPSLIPLRGEAAQTT